ncbi:uncharacterized protein CDV56_100497, partial [Aspergillus thermomutatus]
EHGKGKRKLSHVEEDVAPSGGSPFNDDKTSDALQRDNLDAKIDAEIDALLDNEIDDDEIEVIGDDDIIASPDDIDEDDRTSTSHSASIPNQKLDTTLSLWMIYEKHS